MTNWGNTDIFSHVFPIFRKPDSPGNYNRKIIDSRNYRHRLPDKDGVVGTYKKIENAFVDKFLEEKED